ncbi:hypothetical protein [Chitinophaga sp. HK235]|nr:hypothetical protein [Chitinophaga sp. HK235]
MRYTPMPKNTVERKITEWWLLKGKTETTLTPINSKHAKRYYSNSH